MGSSPTGGWCLLYGGGWALLWWLLFCSPSAWGSGQHVPMLPEACSLYPALYSKGFLGLVNRLTLPMLARVLLEEESLYNEHTNTCPCVFLCMCVDMCMYVYMCALYFHMCACLCAYMCLCLYACAHLCAYAICLYLCVLMCAHMPVHAYMYVCAFICGCMCICTCMCLSIYVCIHACLCVSAHVHVCTWVYVCVHISRYSFYSISKNFNQMNNYFSFMLCSKVILIHLDFSFRNIILENSCLVLIEPTLWGPHQVVVIFKASSSLPSRLTSCVADGDLDSHWSNWGLRFCGESGFILGKK